MEGFESGRFELTARHRRVVARLPFGEELIRVDCHTICAKTLDPVTGATLMVEEEVISEGVKDLLVKVLGLSTEFLPETERVPPRVVGLLKERLAEQILKRLQQA